MKREWLLPVILASVLLGAGLTWLFSTRYYVLSIGSGVVVRTDRWTGKTWRTVGLTSPWYLIPEANAN